MMSKSKLTLLTLFGWYWYVSKDATFLTECRTYAVKCGKSNYIPNRTYHYHANVRDKNSAREQQADKKNNK